MSLLLLNSFVNKQPLSLASSTNKISSNKCFGDRLITLQTVLSKTDQASLWNTIIIDVLGRSYWYLFCMHLHQINYNWNSCCKMFIYIYFFLRTSGKVRFKDILSLAIRLNRFIWNFCCILNTSLAGTITGLPLFPSPGTGENSLRLSDSKVNKIS